MRECVTEGERKQRWSVCVCAANVKEACVCVCVCELSDLRMIH